MKIKKSKIINLLNIALKIEKSNNLRFCWKKS